MLYFVWTTSVALAATSLLLMVGMIVARVVRNLRDRRLKERRAALIGAVLQWLDGQTGEQEVVRAWSADPAVLVVLSAELLSLLRGEEHSRLVALFEACGLPALLRRQVKQRHRPAALLAAENLRYFPGPQTTAVLTAALEHPHHDVRLTAALSLAEHDQAPDIRDLASRLEIGGSLTTGVMTALLRRIAQQQSDSLWAVSQDASAAPLLRVMALDALATTGNYALVPGITQLALNSTGDIAAQALRSLGRLGHPAAWPAVEAGLSSPEFAVRVQAASAAGRIGLLGLADKLAALLADDMWWVRYRAAEALAELGEVGRSLLHRASQAGNEAEARIAALALAEKGLR